MKTKKPYHRQPHGFALLHVLPAFVLVASIAFVGGSVYQAQVKKQDAARQAAADAEAKKLAELSVKQEETAEQKETEVPAPLPEEKTAAPAPTKTVAPAPDKKKTEPSYTTVSIPTTSAAVQAEQVVLTAKLPASYSGTCKALVKLPDGSNAQWLEAAFGPSDTCSISVPKSKLTAGADWKFYMYFKSADGLTKGESGGNLFNL